MPKSFDRFSYTSHVGYATIKTETGEYDVLTNDSSSSSEAFASFASLRLDGSTLYVNGTAHTFKMTSGIGGTTQTIPSSFREVSLSIYQSRPRLYTLTVDTATVVVHGTPMKGDVYSLNLDGTTRDYKVLKNVSGSICEVVCLSSVTSSAFGSSNAYFGNTIDTYLNSTWLSSVTSRYATSPIVPYTTAYQYSYIYSPTPTATGNYVDWNSKQQASTASNKSVRILGVEDIYDYYGSLYTDAQALSLLNADDSTDPILNSIWLSSKDFQNAGYAWYVKADGETNHTLITDVMSIYPVFQLDLSKV